MQTGRQKAYWLGGLSFLAGLGMIVCSAQAMEHFYAANYPAATFQGEFCDLTHYCNCDSFDYSELSQLGHVPIAYLGLMAGFLICLGAAIPSLALERTSRSVCGLNLAGICCLFVAATISLKAVCPLLAGYLLFSILSTVILVYRPSGAESPRPWRSRFTPELRLALVIFVIFISGAYGLRAFSASKEEALVYRAVEQYFSLTRVKLPSFISPYWTVRSTERFEDAPIRVIAFSDLICDNSLYVDQNLGRLKEDFRGQMNVVWQFFPLEAKCNQVSGKDKHPGACEAAYMAAYNPAKFGQLHDQLLAHWEEAADPGWRRNLARQYGVEAGLTDTPTQELVQKIIQTGTEYEKTSNRYQYGIRSTPTMIVNERLIIGTFTYEQLRAIFQRLVDEQQGKRARYMENWPDQPK
jgi:predicted DsbA family dithiol-disulfide isomerase